MASSDPPFGQSSDRPKATAGPRGAAEGVLSEVLRRLIEAGAKNLSAEPVKQLLAEMKIPKDALLHLLTQHLAMQIEETKSAIYSSASRELRHLLERTNLADEIAAALTRLSVDVTMQVRFSPRDPNAAPASGRVKVVTRSDVPRGDVPRSDHPRSDHPRSDHPRSDHPRSDHPRSDHPRSDVPPASEPPAGGGS